MLCKVKRIRCLITLKKIQIKGRQLLIILSLICHVSRIWVATSSGRSQDKDICVSSASDADQSKCYLNSPLRHYKVLHLEPTSTRSYLPRSVLQTKAKLRDAIFFLLQFSNLLCQQNEKELISGGSVAQNVPKRHAPLRLLSSATGKLKEKVKPSQNHLHSDGSLHFIGN